MPQMSQKEQNMLKTILAMEPGTRMPTAPWRRGRRQVPSVGQLANTAAWLEAVPSTAASSSCTSLTSHSASCPPAAGPRRTVTRARGFFEREALFGWHMGSAASVEEQQRHAERCAMLAFQSKLAEQMFPNEKMREEL